MAATGAALIVHDLKNALGSLEARLQALSLEPERVAAVAAHRECRALRQRLVGYLTVYGHDGPLQAHTQDESPLEVLQALCSRHVDDLPQPSLSAPAAVPEQWHFDRHLVMLALEAALHNALRYARQHIELQARAEQGYLVFSVVDDGPGPAAAVDGADGTTGLGTALCRAVAHAHGNTRTDCGVRLYAHPDGGACFELWLPT